VTRNLLVVLLDGASETELREAVEERAGERLNVRLVAPTSVGPLAWLATDEDAARRAADVRALAAEWSLAGSVEAHGEAGDVDPVLAVEDALHDYAADEILIAGGARSNGVLEASLRRFELPVSRLGGPAPRPRLLGLRETARALVGGRSQATPFVLFAGVNLAMAAFAALVAAVVALVLWLA
jgi:hypothetical protein